MLNKRWMALLGAVAAGAACWALPENAVKDALVAPELKNTRVQGPIGAKFDTFMHERCLSDFARNVVVREARDMDRLFRTTPAARLFRGPLLLAKAKVVGDDETDILRADLNKGGWKVKLRPFPEDRVMGAWEATFTRGTEVYKTNVCDFPSAGDSLLPVGANAFSIFF